MLPALKKQRRLEAASRPAPEGVGGIHLLYSMNENSCQAFSGATDFLDGSLIQGQARIALVMAAHGLVDIAVETVHEFLEGAGQTANFESGDQIVHREG